MANMKKKWLKTLGFIDPCGAERGLPHLHHGLGLGDLFNANGWSRASSYQWMAAGYPPTRSMRSRGIAPDG